LYDLAFSCVSDCEIISAFTSIEKVDGQSSFRFEIGNLLLLLKPPALRTEPGGKSSLNRAPRFDIGEDLGGKMKNRILGLIACLFMFVACSSGSSGGGNGGGGGNVTPQAVADFEKQAEGKWVSECQHSPQGDNYRDMVTLQKAGKGSSQMLSYRAYDCSGKGTPMQAAVNIVYTVTSSGGGTSKLQITPEGKTAYEISLVFTGSNQMTITWPSQPGVQAPQTVYDRISGPESEHHNEATVPDQPGSTDATSFDLLAKGRWTSQTCLQQRDGQGSYQMNAIFEGQGFGEFEILSYANKNCLGPAQQSTQQFQYHVDHFQNKAGQITLNGEIMDVMFDVAQMTVITANGNTVFQKAN
jgi:hypothetical protein